MIICCIDNTWISRMVSMSLFDGYVCELKWLSQEIFNPEYSIFFVKVLIWCTWEDHRLMCKSSCVFCTHGIQKLLFYFICISYFLFNFYLPIGINYYLYIDHDFSFHIYTVYQNYSNFAIGYLLKGMPIHQCLVSQFQQQEIMIYDVT